MNGKDTPKTPAQTKPEPRATPLAQPPAESPADSLPKTYDPGLIERRWAEYWVSERLFEVSTAAAKAADGTAGPFTLLLPPPNVTGRLHMGHMLNQTEMDILTRWHRMSGHAALWVPGTDHAGIATQMMVERQLTVEGTTTREKLGREAFTERVWEWKRQYGSAITGQMRRLGASVDWNREYFTMDGRLSVAVKEAFVRLYEQGLIYRGSYIVNWDPIQQTAVSDLEVVHEERLGKLYHIRYPFADGTGSIVVATTRPETLLGDVAIAVNPNDPRYREFIGKLVTLPLSAAAGHADREIPILADDWAQPEFGTGAVKVTPAHDPNDFAIGQRHNLPSLTILDERARIVLPGSPYHGLDRFIARERIVADLEAVGLLVAIEDHAHAIALSQRSGAVIEPRLSMQWFLAVNKPISATRPSIAQTAIDAVERGHIRFTPEMYKKVYIEWMTNIHDWCLSRQLWWGHRIPAWHCTACHAITVARDTPAVCNTCGSADITQETDVLDTWFSSGLLPFTVFGWPGKQGIEEKGTSDREQGTELQGIATSPQTSAASTPFPVPCSLPPDLEAFYPTSLLVTGFDILFFWVARMIMLGTHFMLDVPASPAQQAEFSEEESRELATRTGRPLRFAVPFREVYIHALVRDANREKMSKTKGNVIDPIEIIERFGTDAVRFTLASMASPGTDIAFSEARTEGYRAFANKIWNAARFLFMNLDRARQAGIEVNFREHWRYLNPHIWDGHSTVRKPGQAPAIIPQIEMKVGMYETTESKWILARLADVAGTVDQSLKTYRFDAAANTVYQFFWGDLCDWYLEMVKLRLVFDAPEARPQTEHSINTLVAVFEAALRLLSPFMPFITEEIWFALYDQKTPAKSIALTRFPQRIEFAIGDESISKMETLKKIIAAVRALRKELGVPEKKFTPLRVNGLISIKQLTEQNAEILNKLARVSHIEVTPLGSDTLSGPGVAQWPEFEVQVLYERQIDIPAERERLSRDLAKYENGLAAAERQLSNDAFMAKAPAHIVEGLRKQSAETRTLYDKTKAALAALPLDN